jgi:trehalose 6-phosphate synthase
MLDYDLVGLQTEDDAANLRHALVRDLGAQPVGAATLEAPEGAAHPSRRTRVKAFPIGIDAKAFMKLAERARSNPTVTEAIANFGRRILLIGVDRLDYSKGVAERMEAVERFLISNPDQRGRVSYLQIAPKSGPRSPSTPS